MSLSTEGGVPVFNAVVRCKTLNSGSQILASERRLDSALNCVNYNY